MAELNTITKSGLVQIKKELEEKLLKRDELRLAIEEMRDRGDLSENDGYTLALEDNESNERRIAEIEHIIQTAQVVTDSDTDNHTVSVGNSVEVESNGTKITFMIVGDAESDPLSNKISAGSPIGSALMGMKVGATVSVELPRGKTEYKILKIS